MIALSSLLVHLLAASFGSNDECEQILRDGVMSHVDQFSDTRFAYSYAWEFSKLNTKEARRRLEGKGLVSIAGVPLDAKMSDEQLSSALEQIKSSLNVDIEYLNLTTLAYNIGDASVITAWTHCISNRGGLEIFFKDVSASAATLVLRWRATPSRHHADIESISFGPNVEPGDPTSAKTLSVGTELRHMSPTEAQLKSSGADVPISVSIKVDGATIVTSLPPRLKPRLEREAFDFCEGSSLRGDGTYWGEKMCVRELSVGANSGNSRRLNYRVALDEASIKAGWRINPESVRAGHETVSGATWGTCSSGVASADSKKFTYFLGVVNRGGKTQSTECRSRVLAATRSRIVWESVSALEPKAKHMK